MRYLLLDTPELREVGGDHVVRRILDNAICYIHFDLAKGDKFTVILVGAMMMQAGAKLRPNNKRFSPQYRCLLPRGRYRAALERFQQRRPGQNFWPL